MVTCFSQLNSIAHRHLTPIQHGLRAAAQREAGFTLAAVFIVTVTWATQYAETCP